MQLALVLLHFGIGLRAGDDRTEDRFSEAPDLAYGREVLKEIYTQ